MFNVISEDDSEMLPNHGNFYFFPETTIYLIAVLIVFRVDHIPSHCSSRKSNFDIKCQLNTKVSSTLDPLVNSNQSYFFKPPFFSMTNCMKTLVITKSDLSTSNSLISFHSFYL